MADHIDWDLRQFEGFPHTPWSGGIPISSPQTFLFLTMFDGPG